ncbi:MAG TPA: phosphoenolpyruvate--protein phosphotransferase [Ktedonobacteraceae bacterium]|nr:phosphoenolpyruvate--protein phosphotransferase [Ktedonobacteraceae bacterium]
MTITAIRGIAASPGIAAGPIFRYEVGKVIVEQQHVEDVQREIAHLDAALQQAEEEIQALLLRTQQDIGSKEAAVFEAHQLFLADPELLQQVQATIQEQSVSAAYAWQQGIAQYAAQLRAISDEYLAARAADVEDVAQRVLRILQGIGTPTSKLVEPTVIVATELTPSDTMRFEKKNVLAFCTATGGATSHVAILAKALGIPAITGLGRGVSQLHNGMQVIVDGTTGDVLLEPDTQTLGSYQRRAEMLTHMQQDALRLAQEPAITRDGIHVKVVANIGAPEQAAEALACGAEGVGLLRTEFLFLEREAAPDEDEQVAVYRSVLETMEARPVVARTLDIGGDKPAPYLDMPAEMNPFLGVRGIRLALTKPDLFQTQLRALLRAGVGHTLKLMFPMVASSEEIQAIREHLQQATTTLTARRVSYTEQFELGIMVELPAAALMADTLIELVDFFSIGTNDLAQYTLAADRTNPEAGGLADALHPAVLRLIRMVIEAAHAQGKWVGLCGELAGDLLAIPVLLGLGLDEFSVTPRSVPPVKQVLRSYSVQEAREIARQALALGNASEVRAYLLSTRQ